MNKLVTVTNKDYEALKGENITLVFPLKGFCVGYEYYFDIEEINDYVLINRILNDEELNKLEVILRNSKIKGILFDDLGIIDIVSKLEIKKILILDHIANNTKSINYYLDYVDSVVVSSDLEEKEIRYIVSKAKKPVVIYTFGLKGLMYSRRNLVSNYEKYHHLEEKRVLNSSIDGKYFKAIDSEFGTKFYAYPYYDGTSLLNLDNVCYFWYDPILLDMPKIKEVLKGNLKDVETSKIFLTKKTVYKVGDLDA